MICIVRRWYNQIRNISVKTNDMHLNIKSRGDDRLNYVQPIRDKKKIQTMKTVLKAKDEKYYIMFLIGINVGLRVSDILTLKVSDVRDRTHINIVEKKTGKTKRFLLNSKMQAELTDYISKFSLSDDDYLIRSRKGKNQPIRRDRAYKILNEAAQEIGLDEIGTHSMRKTFGYWHYQKYKDVALLQHLFNHANSAVTLRYIGVNQDIMDQSVSDFFL